MARVSEGLGTWKRLGDRSHLSDAWSHSASTGNVALSNNLTLSRVPISSPVMELSPGIPGFSGLWDWPLCILPRMLRHGFSSYPSSSTLFLKGGPENI